MTPAERARVAALVEAALNEGRTWPNPSWGASHSRRALDALLSAPPEPELVVTVPLSRFVGEPRCEWAEDECGVWQAACGEAFVFEAGGPVENRLAFCCYCGKKLVSRAWTPKEGA